MISFIPWTITCLLAPRRISQTGVGHLFRFFQQIPPTVTLSKKEIRHVKSQSVCSHDGIVSGSGALRDAGAVYSGTIDNTDRAIARLLAKLKEVAPPENTLVFYGWDNGSYRKDRVGKPGANLENTARLRPGQFLAYDRLKGGIASGRVF
jgi:hypothetical protein